MGRYEHLIASLQEFEGLITHMYLDTKGFVTVGVGQMLPNAEAAKQLKFVNATTLDPATSEEIETDYHTVNDQDPGFRAAHYQPFTKLTLPQPEIDALLRKRIQEFETGLKREFPEYESYPEEAQEGLFDMAYNLGLSGLTNKFPSFTEAAKRQDWAKCAEECRRRGIGDRRNNKTRELFERAAEQ